MNLLPLSSVPMDSLVQIEAIKSDGDTEFRLMELGFCTGQIVTKCICDRARQICGYDVLGTRIALRNRDASKVLVKML